MPKALPARPNLAHLRSQAKTLLAKLRAGDKAAIQIFRDHLPEAFSLTPAQIRTRGFRMADAQGAVARQSGFGAWPGLGRHVEYLRSLEGTWASRSLERDGQAVPKAALATSILAIGGDRFRMHSLQAVYEGFFTIDVDQTPAAIDIDFYEGPEAGNCCEGLLELEEDRLRLCLGLAGSKRPERFATAPGSGYALEEFVRVDASPVSVDSGTPPAKALELPKPADGDGFPAELTPTMKQLQGEWRAVGLINSGVRLQEVYLPFGLRTQTGVETKVIFGGQTTIHAKVRFDEGASPTTVDYLHLAGNAAGATSYGLFRWQGDEAVFCVGAPGAARPIEFLSTKGSGVVLSRWKRR